jgi:hypothetical protein
MDIFLFEVIKKSKYKTSLIFRSQFFQVVFVFTVHTQHYSCFLSDHFLHTTTRGLKIARKISKVDAFFSFLAHHFVVVILKV